MTRNEGEGEERERVQGSTEIKPDKNLREEEMRSKIKMKEQSTGKKGEKTREII